MTDIEDLFNDAIKHVKIGTKICGACKLDKPLTEFHNRKMHGDRDGKVSKCKACCKDIWASYYENNKAELQKKGRINQYLRRHEGRITADEANLLVDNRQGNCDICGRVCELMIDHCHVTGQRRGFLCRDCNFFLGLAQDSVAILQQAVDYLRYHREDK